MRALFGNYVLIRKSSIVWAALAVAAGVCAYKYYKKGGDPIEDVKDAAKKGKKKAQDAAEEVAEA